ncbi:MAG: hypothetical protein A3F68_06825 [Acidobacteria bacterium RIFCSPLOWO2_12_FULL_54_10]|nr:MAG: hypothetical protein A3F68_06825 [Acidobacteria bacterium RIFCSPLOWO2_12_FULL_54_10]
MEKVQILQALLTPLIAIITTYIAYQQWNANKLKLKLERYERRLRVYQEVVKFLRLIGRDLDPKVDDFLKFQGAVVEADFLFGPEIRQYIEEIFSRGFRLYKSKKAYDAFTQGSAPSDYDHNRVAREMHSEETWLIEQITAVEGQVAVREKFKPYLDISK